MTLLVLIVWCALAAGISFLATPATIRLAWRIGAIDQPSLRKIHDHPIPRIGGLAIVASACLVFAIARSSVQSIGQEPDWLVIGCGLLPVLGVGLIDDIRGLPAAAKLTGHLLGAAISVSFGIGLNQQVHLFGAPIGTGVAGVPDFSRLACRRNQRIQSCRRAGWPVGRSRSHLGGGLGAGLLASRPGDRRTCRGDSRRRDPWVPAVQRSSRQGIPRRHGSDVDRVLPRLSGASRWLDPVRRVRHVVAGHRIRGANRRHRSDAVAATAWPPGRKLWEPGISG